MILDIKKILSIDNKEIKEYLDKYESHINSGDRGSVVGPDKQLLRYIGQQYTNTVLTEIGTRHATGSLCLVWNNTNTCHTYDIMEYDKVKTIPQIVYFLTNLCRETAKIANLLSSPFVYLDIDPHYGFEENILVSNLSNLNYKGWVLLDDVNEHWPNLYNWFRTLPETNFKKIYLSEFKVGILDFNNNVEIC